MKHIVSDCLPFLFQGFLFAPKPTQHAALVETSQQFAQCLKTFGLTQNTAWIADSLNQLKREKIYEIFSTFIPFPPGIKGLQMAKQISEHPLKKTFGLEPLKTWKLILCLPAHYCETQLSPYKGSKLKELASLALDIYLRDGQVPTCKNSSYDQVYQKLFSTRFPKVSQLIEQQNKKLRDISRPWNSQILGGTNQQSLELKIRITNVQELERAKVLFEKKIL